jgi:hypothetical protein
LVVSLVIANADAAPIIALQHHQRPRKSKSPM